MEDKLIEFYAVIAVSMGLFSAGFFLTLEVTGIYGWYIGQKRKYLPSICEHCCTFWLCFWFYMFTIEITIINFIAAIGYSIAATSVNYLIRK
jgi:hypothetical protein